MKKLLRFSGLQGKLFQIGAALILLLLLFTPRTALAATVVSTSTGGSWSSGTTWVGGVAPGSSDIAEIHTTGANSVTLTSSTTISGLLMDSGSRLTISGNTTVLTVNGYISLTSCWLTVSGTPNIKLTNYWKNDNCVFTADQGTVTFNGTSQSIGGNTNTTFNNLTIGTVSPPTTPTVTINSSPTVNGNLTITSGTLDVSANNYGLTVKGNWSNSGTFTPRAGTVTFNGGVTQNLTGDTTFYNLSVATSGTNVTFSSSNVTVSGTLQDTNSGNNFTGSGPGTLTLGSLAWGNGGAGSGTVTLPPTVTVTADFQLSFGTLDATTNSSTVTFSGTPNILSVNSRTFYNLVFSSTSGIYVASPFSVKGNWTNNGSVDLTTFKSGVTFNGTSAQSIGGSNSTTFYDLTISNPTSVTLQKTATVNNLSVTSGIFNQGTNSSGTSANLTAATISVSSGATYRNRGTGSLTLGGNVTNSGTIDFNGSDGGCSTSDTKISITNNSHSWQGTGAFYMADIAFDATPSRTDSPVVTCYDCTASSGCSSYPCTNGNFTLTGAGTGACTGYTNPTAIKLASFTATEYSGKVLLQWLTGHEVDNLGFNLYREEGGQLIRLNPSLIAGSALLVRGAALTAGLPYQWWDTSLSNQQSAISYQSGNQPSAISGQTSGSSTQSSAPGTVKYWLEDIDLKGKHTMHGPVMAVVSNGPLPQTVKPEFLSELGKRLDERYEEFRRIHDLKQRLGQKSLGSSQLSAVSSQLSVISPQSSIFNPQSSSLSPSVSVTLAQASQQGLINQQWSLVSGPAVKISVKEEGWYRVGQPDLVNSGLNPRINPQYLQLYVDGKEQPIRVIGQEDRQFGPQDAIEFYGTGLDTLSTDTHVYWLIAGSKAGKRIQTYKGGGPSSQTASFPYTVERKDRITYFPALMNGDEDNFFGDFVVGVTPDPDHPGQQPSEVDQLLTVVHTDRAATGSALLEVALQGVTLVPHKVQILFNEVSMGELDFSSQSKGVIQFTIPQSGIPEGSNVVTLIAQGGGDDISLVDHVWLTYWHSYTADQDFLKFTAQGGKKFSFGGFSSENIRVMDITDPGAVVEVIGTVNSQGTGSAISYAMTFGAPGSGQRSLLAFTDETVDLPAAITANQASTWHGGNNGADLVMIAHKQFLDSVRSLKALRTSQGWSVALINVEDLYDEFNFGAKSPQAIKDFLNLAKNQWRKPPRFVLLVGDASYDPRDYLGWSKSGKLDFVPTKLVGTAYQETASDDWFVDVNGDGLPEMVAVGRLPVRTADEATVVVNKIVGYEQSPVDVWARRVVFVADVDPNHEFDFQAATIPLEALIPTGFGVQEIFRSSYSSDVEAKGDILDSIDRVDLGALVVNFIGHGTVLGWGGAGGLLSAKDPKHPELPYGDVSTLTNGLRLPFFISMTCLNGFFQAPYADTLAESLLKAGNGGGIAVWASSGMTEPEGQATLNQALIQLLFNRQGLTGLTLGEATVKAKAAVTDMDIRRTWILFGDPTLKLK